MALEQTSGPPLSRTLVFTNKPQSYLGMALARLRRDPLTLAALAFVLGVGLLAAAAGPITAALGVDPNQTHPANHFQQPYLIPYLQWLLGADTETAPTLLYRSEGVPHWLGTDQLGRDQLARLLYGARVSLSIALVAAALSVVLGVMVGALAGYFGGWVDDIVMWLITTLTTIPDIYLLIIVSAIFRPTPTTLTLFLGFLGWFGTARLMRGNVLKVRSLEYTTAARALGASNMRVMLRHVIPNSLPIIVVSTTVGIGALISAESVLSFLGLGVQPPTATWGNMLYRANEFVFLRDPATKEFMGLHLLFGPGVLITLTVLSFYLIGDGLRDALDPMLKNKK